MGNGHDESGGTPSASDEFGRSRPIPEDVDWLLAEQRHVDDSGHDCLTTTIIGAVAEAEGVEPRDVKTPPLYEVLDTVALESAYFGGDEVRRVGDVEATTQFMYRGFRIEVRSDGWVLVYERRDAETADRPENE